MQKGTNQTPESRAAISKTARGNALQTAFLKSYAIYKLNPTPENESACVKALAEYQQFFDAAESTPAKFLKAVLAPQGGQEVSAEMLALFGQAHAAKSERLTLNDGRQPVTRKRLNTAANDKPGGIFTDKEDS
jgi:hypothetical protein